MCLDLANNRVWQTVRFTLMAAGSLLPLMEKSKLNDGIHGGAAVYVEVLSPKMIWRNGRYILSCAKRLDRTPHKRKRSGFVGVV